jgi:CrcB protein
MRDLLIRYLAIGGAGFIGAVMRVVISAQFGRLNLRFPLGTLFINVIGSLLLGWFLTHIAQRNVSDTLRLAIGAGFVGAFTTFSTFMFESSQLIDEGARLEASTNLLGSLVLGLIAIRLGVLLARWI